MLNAESLRSAISWFVRSWEGLGLLLMRLACGGVLMGEALTRINGIPVSESFIYIALLTPAGLAMLTGYRTRIAGPRWKCRCLRWAKGMRSSARCWRHSGPLWL